MLDAPTLDAVVILAGGDPPPTWLAGELPPSLFVIAADSGLEYARRLGLQVHVLIGDLDSVSPASRADHPDLKVEKHPPDKDKTDLELALEMAATIDVPRVIVVGGTGGRLDHLLANAALLAADRFSALEISWLSAEGQAHIVRTSVEIHGAPGDLVSLIPYAGPAHGVTTRGLRWPLDGDTLPPGTSRGVSNEMTGPVARIAVGEGTLMVVHTAADLA